ncbi:MAG: hypothetical protein ACRD2W_06650 [Acidimicrobiales bacterium]
MAFGLPVEGTRGPYVGSALVDVATCRPDEPVSSVDGHAAVVTGERVVIGEVTAEARRGADAGLRGPNAVEGATVMDVMEVVPDTLRPSVLLDKLDSRAAGRLVTTPDGELLGAVDPSVLPPHEHTH